jgi:hypothetical protein
MAFFKVENVWKVFLILQNLRGEWVSIAMLWKS